MRILLAVLGLSLLTPAQTYIVDANNGPGTRFLDLPPAILAVPDGAALRVRPGTYSSFTVGDKSLTILGDPGTTVRSPGFAVAGTSLGKRVVIEGLTYRGNATIAACPGAVQLTRIDAVLDLLSPTVVVQDSGNVHLHTVSLPEPPFAQTSGGQVDILRSCVEMLDCRFFGIAHSTPGATGWPAVQAQTSRLSVFRTSLRGGDGGTDLFNSFGAGGPGLLALDSVVDLGPGNTFTGGQGGIDPTGLGCYWVMGRGGPGLRLVRSRGQHFGTTFRGGEGPCFVCFSTPCNTFGPPTSLDASSVLQPVASAPSTAVSGSLAIGGYVDFAVSGQPQELALLVFGFRPACIDLPQLVDFGGILAMPDIPFGVFVTDGNGRASYRLPLLPGFVLDRVVWAQFFTFQGMTLPGKGSNSVSFAVRS